MQNFSNFYTLSWENFENVIKSHGWNYDYSDDHSVYTRGYNREGWLLYAFDELSKEDEKRAVEIWNKYAPANRQRELHLF